MKIHGKTDSDFAGLASVGALLVGDLVLVGWWAGIEGLKCVVPGYDAMTPLAALTLAIAGLSLWLVRDTNRRWSVRIGRGYGALIASAGAVSLVASLAKLDRGLDMLWFSETLDEDAVARTTPVTALAIVLVGASLAVFGLTTRGERKPSRGLALGATVLPLIALAGAARDSHTVYRSSMGSTSAALFALFALGIFAARPRAAGEAVAFRPRPGAGASLGGVELRGLVEDIIGELSDETALRALEWRVAQLPTVGGDPSMIREALTALIGGAVRRTVGTIDALIEIGCAPGKKGEVIVFVRDNGAASDTGSGDPARAREIVERHGGRFWSEAGAGRGSSYCFAVPQKPAAAARAS
jgi:signal transduction histidine kinase